MFWFGFLTGIATFEVLLLAIRASFGKFLIYGSLQKDEHWARKASLRIIEGWNMQRDKEQAAVNQLIERDESLKDL